MGSKRNWNALHVSRPTISFARRRHRFLAFLISKLVGARVPSKCDPMAPKPIWCSRRAIVGREQWTALDRIGCGVCGKTGLRFYFSEIKVRTRPLARLSGSPTNARGATPIIASLSGAEESRGESSTFASSV